MIDPKYCTRALSPLSNDEKIREVTTPKVGVYIELFVDDYDLAQSLKVNVSRILRFKFHEWLSSKTILTSDPEV